MQLEQAPLCKFMQQLLLMLARSRAHGLGFFRTLQNSDGAEELAGRMQLRAECATASTGAPKTALLSCLFLVSKGR